MVAKRRRHFTRQTGQRSYRKLFIIATEGLKTEPQYFKLFRNQSLIHIECLTKKYESSPRQVLERLKEHIRKKSLREEDEAWLVVDKDHWSDAQLRVLYDWTQKQNNYRLAVSNPKFEFWLLLHFEDGNSITAGNCTMQLQTHLPDYDKKIDASKFPPAKINDAVSRAKLKDNPRCSDWPRNTGTTVYRLVENILSANDRA